MSEQDNQKHWKDGWEYKSAKMILRIIAVLLVLAYLSMTWRMAWQWGQLQMVRNQPISNITQIAENSIKNKDPEELKKWVSYRDQYVEGDEIITLLTPYAHEISSVLLFSLSKMAFHNDHVEDALFWYQYAYYRFRFDAMRCALKDSPKLMQGLLDLMNDARLNEIKQALPKDPKELTKILQRVMDFDAEHPARNYPIDTCNILAKLNGTKPHMQPPSEWARIRHVLRNQTEGALTAIRERNK